MIGYIISFVVAAGAMYALKWLPEKYQDIARKFFNSFLWFSGGMIVGVIVAHISVIL